MSYYGPSSNNEPNGWNRGARRGGGRSGAWNDRRNTGNYSNERGGLPHNPNHGTYPRGRGRSQYRRSSYRPYERRVHNTYPVNNSSFSNHQHTNRNNGSYNFNRDPYTASARHENNGDKKLPSISFEDTKEEESKPKNNDTNWNQFSFEDEAKSQYFNDPNSHFSSEGLVPDDRIDQKLIERKMAAAEYAWTEVNKKIDAINDEAQKNLDEARKNLETNYDSDDSSDPGRGARYGDPETFGPGNDSDCDFYEDSDGVKSFILALPYCIYMDQGLHSDLNQSKSGKPCRCPCSKYMKEWKTNFGLNDSANCENKPFDNLDALLQHMQSKNQNERDFYHHGTELYLKKLYGRL